MIILDLRLLIIISQIVLYFLHSTLVLSIYIDVVLTLFTGIYMAAKLSNGVFDISVGVVAYFSGTFDIQNTLWLTVTCQIYDRVTEI